MSCIAPTLRLILRSGKLEYAHNANLPPWRISLIDTGNDTQTGGRLKRIKYMLPPDQPFCMTYGDGVANVNIKNLIDFHRSHGLDATVTVVRPPGRFGAADIDGHRVTNSWKSQRVMADTSMVVSLSCTHEYLTESKVIRRHGNLLRWKDWPRMANWRRSSTMEFWQPMDTLRDKQHLEQLWDSGRALWKVWS